MSDNEEWEEWDGSSPFWHHCVAGSMAGLTEHGVVFPLDTVRTHIQVCASCPKKITTVVPSASASASVSTSTMMSSIFKNHRNPTSNNIAANAAAASIGGRSVSGAGTKTATVAVAGELPQGMLQTIRYLVSQPVSAIGTLETAATATATATNKNNNKAVGITRLFRGIQTVFIGCIPAHALYFSNFEIIKAHFTEHNKIDNTNHLPMYGSMIAGAVASTSHDCIMSPLDTVKQRLQLGHYDGSVVKALRSMIGNEGIISLYRSFPVTLVTNMPYGMIMVTTNESLKELWINQLIDDNNHNHNGNNVSTSDIKLPLSTTLLASSIAGFTASACTTPLDRIKTSLQTQKLIPACLPKPIDCPLVTKGSNVIVKNWYEAFNKILVEEGPIGFFRGIVPRVISHTPAVAISWTTYETAKQLLSRHFS
jgi:solute carrier family 25 iron transporter 28/37